MLFMQLSSKFARYKIQNCSPNFSCSTHTRLSAAVKFENELHETNAFKCLQRVKERLAQTKESEVFALPDLQFVDHKPSTLYTRFKIKFPGEQEYEPSDAANQASVEEISAASEDSDKEVVVEDYSAREKEGSDEEMESDSIKGTQGSQTSGGKEKAKKSDPKAKHVISDDESSEDAKSGEDNQEEGSTSNSKKRKKGGDEEEGSQNSPKKRRVDSGK